MSNTIVVQENKLVEKKRFFRKNKIHKLYHYIKSLYRILLQQRKILKRLVSLNT